MLKRRSTWWLMSSLIVVLALIAWVCYVRLRPGESERYLDATSVDQYRETARIVNSEFWAYAYWVGPAGADVQAIVSGPNLVWTPIEENDYPMLEGQGFVVAARGVAHAFGRDWSIYVDRLDIEDPNAMPFLEYWKLTAAQASGVRTGQLDLLMVGVA